MSAPRLCQASPPRYQANNQAAAAPKHGKLNPQYKDYGLTNPDVPRALVRAFFSYWWPTPIYSANRGRVRMAIVQGPLDGRAVAIVDSKGARAAQLSHSKPCQPILCLFGLCTKGLPSC